MGTADALSSVMERKLITCPDTGHLEEVELDHTPAGLVVAGCTRFQPRCAIDCPRECARRLDRRDREAVEDRQRVLVLYALPAARPVAEVIAARLGADGFIAELVDAASPSLPPPEDYDAVVLGSASWLGRPARPIIRYVRDHRDALAAMPGFLFAVGTEGSNKRLIQRTGWHPTDSTTFVLGRGRMIEEWSEVGEFALRIADEIPSALVEPSML
jgi:hypothetical protein